MALGALEKNGGSQIQTNTTARMTRPPAGESFLPLANAKKNIQAAEEAQKSAVFATFFDRRPSS
jgi:hypothetical protein